MTTEPDNARRWRPDRAGVYEVWYATWNDPRTDQGFWLRFITEAPTSGPARGELWFARFDPRRPERTFGIHKHFAAAVSEDAPFRLAIGGAELAHDRSRGELSGGGHSVRWDLRWEPAARTLRFYPDAFYRIEVATSALSPNPRVPLSGTLVVDGEELSFDRAICGQSHVWGQKHALSWVWAHCGDFAGAPGAVFELVGGRVQRGRVTLPVMAGAALVLDGEEHRLNRVRNLPFNRAAWRPGLVTFTARSATVKLEGELTCVPGDMVNAPYVDPDGTALWCANTEIADARLVVYRRGLRGWREHRRLEAHRRAHFECGSRERDPSVTRPHVLVT